MKRKQILGAAILTFGVVALGQSQSVVSSANRSSSASGSQANLIMQGTNVLSAPTAPTVNALTVANPTPEQQGRGLGIGQPATGTALGQQGTTLIGPAPVLTPPAPAVTPQSVAPAITPQDV